MMYMYVRGLVRVYACTTRCFTYPDEACMEEVDEQIEC